MGTYLVNFIAYTFAMIGLICLCLFIYKKCFVQSGAAANADFLQVENQLNLSARKSIYVVRAGEEKFLIASDTDKTAFLSKLSTGIKPSIKSEGSVLAGVSIAQELQEKHSDQNAESNVTKLPVMKELMRKLNS